MKTALHKIQTAFRVLKVAATASIVGEEIHVRFEHKPAKATILCGRPEALAYGEALADLISARA